MKTPQKPKVTVPKAAAMMQMGALMNTAVVRGAAVKAVAKAKRK